ncbi:MAG: hypothetical protein AAB343_01185, partial [Patescibacteria group bacterium]
MEQCISFDGKSLREVDNKVNAWLKSHRDDIDVVRPSLCVVERLTGELYHKTTIWYKKAFPFPG